MGSLKVDMAGTASDAVGRTFEVSLGGQQQSQAASEALAEWRSSEQVENGSPSTSPTYWDTDDDDCGMQLLYMFVLFMLAIDMYQGRKEY